VILNFAVAIVGPLALNAASVASGTDETVASTTALSPPADYCLKRSTGPFAATCHSNSSCWSLWDHCTEENFAPAAQ
jgi:hypothetical protein